MKKRTAVAFTAAVLTLFICFFAMIAPSFSRPANTQKWTGTVQTERIESGVRCDLLSPEGREVFIKKSSMPDTVTINFESYGGASEAGEISISTDEATSGWLAVTASESTLNIPANGTVSVALSLERNTEGDGTEPDELKFSVSFHGENVDLQASFTAGTQFADRGGSIVACSDYYGQNVPIVFTVDKAASVLYGGSAFPAMTEYTVRYDNGNTDNVLLYTGGYVITDGAATVSVDMSKVDPDDVGTVITLSADNTVMNPQNCGDPPALTARETLIIDSETEDFLTVFEMNGETPKTTVQRLTKAENGWTDDGKITLEQASDGSNKAVLRRNGAEPGTYRVNVSWTFEGVLIYERDVIIYVRYPAV